MMDSKELWNTREPQVVVFASAWGVRSSFDPKPARA